MNEKKSYRLENIRKKEMTLRSVRQEVLSSAPEKALDLILDAPAPASLIQSFPGQDLYYLMHKIGSHDFIPILSLARSDQWEYILDVETWDNDRLDIDGMTAMFDLLYQADPQRLLRWSITEKPEYLEFYLLKNMDIHIREHDEIPPADFDDYITLDDKFYFRFPQKPGTDQDEMPVPGDHQPAWELIEKMLKSLALMDISVFHGLMLETTALLPAETEEEQFRLKTIRLAEKGFLPAHEAVGIYQPLKLSAIGKRPAPLETRRAVYDPDIPMPPQFFFGAGDEANLVANALNAFDPETAIQLESEIAALINKVISADKIRLRSKEDLEKAMTKAWASMNLGLEVMLGHTPSPGEAQAKINDYFLEDIFRAGSRAAIKLTTQASRWFKNSYMNQKNLPLSFLGETYLGIIGGLFLERPLFFDNYVSGELYRNFKSLLDIDKTRDALDQVEALDRFLSGLNPDISTFTQGVLTYKTLILTLWAKNRMGLPGTLEPIEIKPFEAFFSALFTENNKKKGYHIQLGDLRLWATEAAGMDDMMLPEPLEAVLSGLISELDEEYGAVDARHIDARFMPHFLLKQETE